MKISEIGFVYMITSPTNKIYVGSTIDLDKRIYDYKRLSCKRQPKLYNSLKKYGFNNHKFEVLWAGLLIDMYKYETMIGWGFNSLEPYNLNCKLPKLGNVYSVTSNESRQKMSISTKGMFHSIETKRKISNSKIGKKRSIEIKQKISKTQKKAIIQMDLNGNFIKEWDSAIDVSKSLNINCGNISMCCKNKLKQTRGFTWKFKK